MKDVIASIFAVFVAGCESFHQSSNPARAIGVTTGVALSAVNRSLHERHT
jgi:hypothetical protein